MFVDDNNVRGLGLGAEISLRIDFEDFIREEGKKRSEGKPRVDDGKSSVKYLEDPFELA